MKFLDSNFYSKLIGAPWLSRSAAKNHSRCPDVTKLGYTPPRIFDRHQLHNIPLFICTCLGRLICRNFAWRKYSLQLGCSPNAQNCLKSIVQNRHSNNYSRLRLTKGTMSCKVLFFSLLLLFRSKKKSLKSIILTMSTFFHSLNIYHRQV